MATPKCRKQWKLLMWDEVEAELMGRGWEVTVTPWSADLLAPSMPFSKPGTRPISGALWAFGRNLESPNTWTVDVEMTTTSTMLTILETTGVACRSLSASPATPTRYAAASRASRMARCSGSHPLRNLVGILGSAQQPRAASTSADWKTVSSVKLNPLGATTPHRPVLQPLLAQPPVSRSLAFQSQLAGAPVTENSPQRNIISLPSENSPTMHTQLDEDHVLGQFDRLVEEGVVVYNTDYRTVTLADEGFSVRPSQDHPSLVNPIHFLTTRLVRSLNSASLAAWQPSRWRQPTPRNMNLQSSRAALQEAISTSPATK
jgi:hypothetical protein